MTQTSEFQLTDKQRDATALLAGPAMHILLRGGARSGKTFAALRAIAIRALKAEESRHAVFRFRLNHIKQSILQDTWPKMMRLCFPTVPFRLHQTDFFVDMPNKSRIVFGGLDDAERTEKILGQEYATIYLNECSQISYDARNKVITRLAQQTNLKLKAYYDANPPTMGHWTYRMFEQKLEPKSGMPLTAPENYATMMLNPDSNRQNLAPEYIANLEALPEKDRRRFLHGEYLAQVEGALWTLDLIDRNRGAAPKNDAEYGTWQQSIMERMQRIVVAIDPSGCSGPEDVRSDEIGIVVCGMDRQNRGFVLEDCSGRYSPEGWAARAVKAYDDWRADKIVGERNFGGAMVESTIKAHRKTAPVMLVDASRGKTQRAEPIAALYEQGKVQHCGMFPDLEDQMCNFSTAGYQGPKSPDRADALVWCLTELMISGDAFDQSYSWV